MKSLNRLLLIILFLTAEIVYSQGGAPSCAELQANFALYQSCATSIPFTNSTNNTSGETFTTTCIREDFRGPTWFFMKIKTGGDVLLRISQVNNAGASTDVDFVLWGPFNNLTNICSQLDISKEVDCSWSPNGVENVSLRNTIAGELYILLVDNYSNSPGQITITQTGGTGSSDCSFLTSVKITDNAGNDITQLNYCKPDTKDLVAAIDASDFSGNPSDLRFNYKWYRNDQLIATIASSASNTNTLTVSESGNYKVETSSYDSSDPTVNQNTLRVNNANITLNFFTQPNMTLQSSNTQCLGSNPILQTVDNNTAIETYTYEWFRNLTSMPGVNGSTFTPTLPGTYFVRISNPGCPPFDTNSISIYETPQVSITDNQFVCEGNSYQITSSIPNLASLSSVTYQWYKDGNLILGATADTYTVSAANQNVYTSALYTLKVTESGQCTTTSNAVFIRVVRNIIPLSITGDPAEQITFESDSKVVAIVTPQSPDFQYMIDDNGWQDSNVFYNVKEGVHILRVRNRYGCGEISTRIVVVDYPKYFTPNGDGFNDTWNIGGRTSLDISNIYIFDRYGKILTDLRRNGIGWDGMYNGHPMPADDYWFKIIYEKDGIKREFKNHFSLKR